MAQNFLSDIKLGDSIYIRLGDGTNGDLRLYHNATHSYIDGANTGDLYIRSLSDDVVIQGADDVFIYTQGGEDAIIARGDAGVELFYNTSRKIETTNIGATVTGTLTATEFVGGGAGITGVTAEWDGSHTGNATITGNLEINNYLKINPAASGGTSTFIDWRNNGTLFAYQGSAAAIISGGSATDYVAGNTTGATDVILSTNNTARLTISGSGASTFSGTVAATGLTTSGVTNNFTHGTSWGVNLQLTNTNDDASPSTLTFLKDPASGYTTLADNDYIGFINFRAKNSNNDIFSWVELSSIIIDVTDGSEDSAFRIGTWGAGTEHANTIIAKSGNVGIGVATPASRLDVTGTDNGDTVRVANTGTYGGTISFNQGAGNTNIGYVGSLRALEGNASGDNGIGLYSRDRISFYTNSTTPDLTIADNGNATFAGAVAISHGSGDTLTLTKSTTEPSMRFEGDTDKDFCLTISGETFTVTQNDGATDILTLDHDTKAATFAGYATATRIGAFGTTADHEPKAAIYAKSAGNNWEDGLLLVHDNANTGWNFIADRTDSALLIGYNSDTSASYTSQSASTCLKLHSNLTATFAGGIIQSMSNPYTKMIDTSSGGDTYGLNNNQSKFSIYNWTDGREELYFGGDGNATFAGNLTVQGATTQLENNVLIGNSSTDYLEVRYNNSAQYATRLKFSGLQFGNNGSNKLIAGRTGAGGYFDFYTNNTNDGLGGTPDGALSLTLQADGDAILWQNVGVGTSAPGAKLNVFTGGNSIAAAAVLQHDTFGADRKVGLGFELGDTQIKAAVGFISDDSSVGTHGRGNLIFCVDSNDDAAPVGHADEKMRITHAGKVGINTAVPDADLQIITSGSSDQDGILKIGGSATSLGLVIDYDQSSATVAKITSNPTYTNTGALMKLCVDGDANANQLVLKGDGKVGINTDAPGSKLDVREDANNVYTGYFYNSADAANAHGANIQIASSQASTYGLRVNTGGNSNALTVMGNSRVGIGTFAPDMQLDVVGNIRSRVASNVAGGFYIGEGASAEAFGLLSQGANGYFKIRDEYNNADRFYIENDGKVGIGTTNPQRRLSVYQGDSGESYSQFINTTTGSNAGDGLLVGIAADERAIFWNHENTNMVFATNNDTKLTIAAGGDATFTQKVGVGGKTPAYGLSLAQGTGVNNKIAWTDGTPSFRASMWANSSDDKFKIATGNASSVETVALEIDTSQNATFTGDIIGSTSTQIYAGPASTNGGRVLAQNYSSPHHLGVISSHYSSGNIMIGYGAEGKSGGSGYVSTYANFSGDRSVLEIAAASLNFKTVGSAVQTAVGSDITLASRFSVGTSGNGTFAGYVKAGSHFSAETAGQAYIRFKHGSGSLNYLGASESIVPAFGDENDMVAYTSGKFGVYTAGTLALTLDESQNATFAGTVNITAGTTGSVGGGHAGIVMTNKFDNPDNSFSIKPQISGVANTGLEIRDETDNASRLVINGSGNVGIGTNNPAFPLEVENSSTAYVFSQTTGASASSGYRWKTPDSEFAWFSTGGTNAMALYDYVASAERMRITSAGNVLLNRNTDVTNQLLQVNGFIDITDVTGTALRWYDGSTFRGGLGLDDWATSGSASDITLYSTGSLFFVAGGGNNKRMIVKSDGNVGIGTATPYAKLDVVNGTNNNEAANATDFRFVAANRAITTERANMEIYTNNAQAADLGGSIGFGGRHTDSSTNDSLFATIKAGKSNATTGNYLGYLEIGTSDAASDITRRFIIDSTGATFAGAVTTTGSVTVGNQAVTSSTTNYENVLRIKGKNNYSNNTTWYGTYGQILLHSDTNMTGNARRYLITNAYNNRDFAIVRSVDGNTDPVVNSTNTGVNSGSADFVIDYTGKATFAGNVGIGTTSPTGYRLVVENTSEDLLKLHNSTDGLDALISFTNPGGTLGRIQGIDNGGLGFDVGNNAGGIVSNAMFIQNNGNVGIGNTNPSRPLDITSDSGAVALKLRARSGNDYAFLSFTQNDGSGTIWAELAGMPTGLRIDTNGSQKMRIDNGGSVAIGNFTPSGTPTGDYRSLEIGRQGNTLTGAPWKSNLYFSTNATITAGSSAFTYRYASVAPTQMTMEAGVFTWSNAAAGTVGNTISFTERMRIDSAGKVMIGTTTAGRMLSINGGTGNDGAVKLETTSTASNFWSGVELKSPNAQSFIYMSADDTAGTIKFVPAGSVKAHINATSFICAGDVVAFGSPSDISLKENIQPINNALDKVSKLKGVTFDWKQSDSLLEIKEDIGFIAQDVQKVLPELVRENEDGKLSMRHQGVIPILVEAIKELKAEIEELKKCNKCDNCNCENK